MKKLNIFIADKDNRDVTSLVYHYCKLGHRVFLPRPGTAGFALQPSWPRLLMKSSKDTSKRNLDIYGYEKYDEVKFGEDRFISQEIDEIQQKLYEADVSCELVDVEKDDVHIDAWHTTPNSIVEIREWMDYARKHFPHAKWISSCMTHWDHSLSFNPQNLVKFLPANYRDIRPDLNQTKMYRHRIEFEIMNIDYQTAKERSGWASFNHNFSVRQPQHFALQQEVNARLAGKIHIPNFGGNIRVVGADIKYSGENGITGKDQTLSPRQAMRMYTQLRGVLHLKQADWAGGVPSMSRMAKCPIIVTQKYIEDTKSEQMLVHGFNCISTNNVEEVVDAVSRINDDDQLWRKLSEGQDKMNEILFDENYWQQWEQFMENLV